MGYNTAVEKCAIDVSPEREIVGLIPDRFHAEVCQCIGDAEGTHGDEQEDDELAGWPAIAVTLHEPGNPEGHDRE